MLSKVILGNPNWPPAVIFVNKIARNAIKSNFRVIKMASGGHFVKKVAYWSDMR